MREQVGVHADHMVPLRHSGPERMTVALGAVALVPFGSGSNCACFLRTGGLDGAPELCKLRLDGVRTRGTLGVRNVPQNSTHALGLWGDGGIGADWNSLLFGTSTAVYTQNRHTVL